MQRVPGRAASVWLLVAAACAPFAAFAQTAGAPAAAEPHYRGIVTLPPPGTQPPAPAWVTPPSAPTTAPSTTANGGMSPQSGPDGGIVGRPLIHDTATLIIDGHAVLVAGIEGVQGGPLTDFKDAVQAAGGTVSCIPANAGSYTFTCRLADGSDLAMVALVNGAARTASDAPAAYRTQEAAARARRIGIWAHAASSPAQDIASCRSAPALPRFGG